MGMTRWNQEYRPGCMQTGLLIGFGVVVLIAGVIVWLFGGGSDGRAVQSGRVLLQSDFADSRGDWRAFEIPGAADFQWNSDTRTFDGSVLVNVGHLVTTNQTDQFTDTVFQAEIAPLVEPSGAAVSAGVMCRADPDGNGYYFLFSTTGNVGIMRGVPDETDLLPVVAWHAYDGIFTEGRNVIRAVCADNYLAFYLNGELVAEGTDDTFSSGWAGLTVAGTWRSDAITSSSQARVVAAFDNVRITDVTAIAGS